MNETRLSFGLKIMVLLVVLSEQTVLFIIPSLIIYMIDHLTKISEIETTPELIGNYLALIEGLNRGFIIIGGLIWGYLSDKTNRKFCLALSITCFSFTSLGFGLSSSLESAIFWRVFSGLSSGSINILKATIPDLTTDENISELYKFFSAGFGVASILGPLLAGFFSSPSKNFSIFQNSSFFQSYPYFLPFLINAFIDLAGVIFVLFYVPGKKKLKREKNQEKNWVNQQFLICTAIFAVHAFCQFSFRALMPLWLHLDENQGGVGWKEEKNAGTMNFLSGFIVALLPFWLTPRLSKNFGVFRSLFLLEFILGIFMVLPLLSKIFSGLSFLLVLSLTNGLNVCFSIVFISFVSIAISNSVRPDCTGVGVAFAQTVVAVLRTLAASTSSAAFGKICENHFFLNYSILFVFNGMVLVVNGFFIWKSLGPQVNFRRQDLEEDQKIDTE